MKEKLQEKLKKSREEAEERKKEVTQLQSKVNRSIFSSIEGRNESLQVNEGALLMEGEEEILKGTEMKYIELFPERSYKQGNENSSRPVFGHPFDSFLQVRRLKFIFVWPNRNFTDC